MRSSTLLSRVAVAAAIMVGLVAAQTPPEYKPASQSRLAVAYGNKTVTPGINLPQKVLGSAPKITYSSGASVVVMLDLDAPFAASNRTFSPLCHLITTASSELVPYAPPAPPAGSPDHRYVLLAYKRSTNSTGPFALPDRFKNTGASVTNRLKFDLAGFEREAGLVGPVAANWFLVSAEKGNGTGASNSTAPPQYKGDAGYQIVKPALVTVMAAGVAMLMAL